MKKFLAILLLTFLTGCSLGWKSYPNEAPKNLTISVDVRWQSIFAIKSFNVSMYKENPANIEDCDIEYAGSVKLNKNKPTKIGLPKGQRAYLTMIDDGGNRTKYMNFSFVPQSGYDYNIKYIVDKDKYGYEMTQTNSKTGRTTDLEYDGWNSDCDN